MATSLRTVTIGVGHLRRQVTFYGSNLGLRVAAKGRVPAAQSRQIWGVDDDLDVVTVARQDLPDALRVRLMRTSDLPARPDFDLTVPGPVGLVLGTKDLRRLYYRLSGAGVEFHLAPGEGSPDHGATEEAEASEPGGDAEGLPTFGRAYDGEYVVLRERGATTAGDGTVSPYFGVTEPLEVLLVVRDMEAAALFLVDGLAQEPLDQGRVDEDDARRAMGLPPGAAFHWRTFAAAPDRLPRLRLICFGDGQSQESVAPPSRGLSALAFDVDDLDRVVGRAERSGGRVVVPVCDVSNPALGAGRSVGLSTPLGVRVELWRPRSQ